MARKLINDVAWIVGLSAASSLLYIDIVTKYAEENAAWWLLAPSTLIAVAIVRGAGIHGLLNWFVTYYCTKRYPNDPAVKQTRLLEAAKRTGSMIDYLSGLAVMNVHHFFHSGREESGRMVRPIIDPCFMMRKRW